MFFVEEKTEVNADVALFIHVPSVAVGDERIALRSPVKISACSKQIAISVKFCACYVNDVVVNVVNYAIRKLNLILICREEGDDFSKKVIEDGFFFCGEIII